MKTWADIEVLVTCLLTVRIQITPFLQLQRERKGCSVKLPLSKTGAPADCTGRIRVADPFLSDENLRPLVYRSSRAPLASLASFVSVHGHTRLFFEPLNLLILNADPDPGSKKNADPDPKPWAEPFSLVIKSCPSPEKHRIQHVHYSKVFYRTNTCASSPHLRSSPNSMRY